MRILCGVVSLCLATSVFAAEPPAPKWGEVDQSVGKENYAEAKKSADAILQRGTPDDRVKTMQVYGRILLGLGQKDEARQYLRTITGGRKGRGAATGLPAIYAAWLKAYDKPEEAIKTLEKMLEQSGSAPDETAAEAADVLAMLYMARGEQDKAKKAVDFGLKTLQYRGKKDGYVLALLQNRLNSDIAAGQAKRLYNEAEKLRSQNKFTEAGQLFAQVRAMYPKNPWAHASGFRIGQCFLGLNQSVKAADWWQKFIKESPAGPWRGQAYVGLIDVSLETQLDLKRATELVMEASATLAKATEPSWKEAAYDIHLRQGIVSLADGRFDAAVQGFRDAKPSAPGDVQAGLDRLTEAALNRAKLVPDELCVGDDRATTALVLGNIYNVLHQYDAAKRWFSLLLNGSLRSHSAAHRSFAGLGLARAVIASDKSLPGSKASPLAQAKTIYEASLQEFPKASWHDETLRELALSIERAANEAVPKPATTKSPNPVSTESAKQQQWKAIIAARAQALPFWLDLPKRYPTSRHVPQSLYHAGILYTETGKPDEALATFEELTKKHPDSPWSGDAHVRLIDVKLEQQFDLPGAKEHVNSAVAWYEKTGAGDGGRGAGANNSPRPAADVNTNNSPRPLGEGPGVRAVKTGSTIFPDDTLPTARQTGYDIYVRAGLVEYLTESGKGDCPSPSGASPRGLSPLPLAVAFFEKAKPLQPDRNFVVVHGTIPTGIERLIEAAKSNKSLTPEIVRKGDEKAKLILMLADVYFQGREFGKSRELCNQAINSKSVLQATREQRSYAYFKRALSCFSLHGQDCKPDLALADYVAAVRAAPNVSWASTAMFYAANIEWNYKHDPNAAVSIWNRLIRNYPKSKEADASTLFIGVVYQWTNRPDEARKVLANFMVKHPDSPLAEGAQKQLAKLDSTIHKNENDTQTSRHGGDAKTGQQ